MSRKGAPVVRNVGAAKAPLVATLKIHERAKRELPGIHAVKLRKLRQRTIAQLHPENRPEIARATLPRRSIEIAIPAIDNSPFEYLPAFEPKLAIVEIFPSAGSNR